MTNVAVVGAQWGDEGKGKIVDWLSERAEVVVRFQGGHNAGHTLVVNGRTYKLSLLPSGVVRPGKLSIIGNGVVIDPWALLDEIEAVRGQGVAVGPDSLRIAENAPLILPLHGELDRARERARKASTSGTGTLGTTGRGIGPAYEDKIARRAIRVCDLADPDLLAAKIEELLRHHNALRQAFGEAAVEPAELVARLNALAPRLLPYAEPVWLRLVELRRRGARILFEGAQGAMLDIDHGTYPFVTSSNTLAGRRPRLAPAPARMRSASRSASPRPIPRGSARARSRPSLATRSAAASASAAASSARSPAGRAAAAGSTPSWSARRSRSAASMAWR